MRARQAQEAIEKSPWHHDPEPPIHQPPRRHCRKSSTAHHRLRGAI